MSIRLSRDEAWEVLASAHTGIFTSLRADGMPIALPVWFVAFDERVYVDSVSHLKKVARVRRDPRVSFLVESGRRWADLRGVHLTGTAQIVSDPALIERVADALHTKYAAFRSDRSAMPERTRSHYEMNHVTIQITADARILTWDNARISLRDV
jgi:PPOX class probable F420-dependent enzyme